MLKKSFNITTKFSASEKTVFVEGLANPATPDRERELIPPEAWQVNEFQKNPIMFFNHDRSIPIGKWINVKVTENGLLAKGELSRSKNGIIPYLRDLVKEGILKTMSVGFDAPDGAEEGTDGIKRFKQANLLEISLVTLPMHQDAVANVLSKALKDTETKCKAYCDLREEILHAKGAKVAAIIQNELAKLEDNENKKRDDILANLKNYEDYLSGDITPIPDDLLQSLSDTLSLDYIQLKELNEAEGNKIEGNNEDEEDDKEEDKEPEEKQEAMVLQSLIFDKNKFSKEEAMEWARSHDYSVDKVDETETSYRIRQKGPDEFQEGSFRTVDIGSSDSGIKAVMGKLKATESQESEEEEKPKEDDKPKEKEPESKQSQPIESTNPPNEMGENPFYDQSKQTNILLSQVLGELQKLNAHFATIPQPEQEEPPPPQQEPQSQAPPQEQNIIPQDNYRSDGADYIKLACSKLDKKLKSLGV